MESIYAPIEGEPQIFKKPFILMPELWERFKYDDLPEVDFTNWGKVKILDEDGNFSADLKNIPNEYGGIYIFCVVPNIIAECGSYILYIGMATKTDYENLRDRVKSYKTQMDEDYKRHRIHNMFSLWGDYMVVYYLPIDASVEVIQTLEDRLIACFVPPCNSDIRDVEVKRKVKAFTNF